MNTLVKVAPSILSADFTNLKDEILRLNNTEADYIHIDIMDGHFVPNLTFGASIVKQLRPLTKKIFDTHLMVQNPENFVDDFIKAKVDIITFHIEATTHHDRLVKYIKDKGIKVGIALNPSTHENVLEYLVDEIDLILVMTVNPGFGGQKFLSNQLTKIKNIKDNFIKNKNIDLEVDGGVNFQNSINLVQAGANVLVAGTTIFQNNHYAENISKLKGL